MCKKEKTRRQKGITLIALVITIIVLIILAGVSINLVLGENGIITKAKEGRENYQIAANEEQSQLGNVEELIDGIVGESSKPTEPIIRTYEVTFSGTNVTSNGEETVQENLEYTTTLTPETGYNITSVTVKMGGTTLVENTGYTYTNGVLKIPSVTGNIEIITTVEEQSIIGPVAGGSYDNPYIPTGFKYKEGSWNNGYTIIGDTESVGNEFVWVPCVTDQSKVKSGDTVVTFGKKTDTTKYKPSSMTITGEEGTTASEIEASVATYGGFYIARYEAGISGTTENYSLSPKTATDGSVKPLSKPGCGVWNSISRANAITVSNCMIDTAKTGAKSALISGAAWDTTLQWIVNASDNKNNEPNLGYDTNSTENGWYSDISNSTRHLTGYYAVNNIYDMAGNVCDWTTENCTYSGVSYVLSRGGHYDDSGFDHPAAFRYGSTDYASNTLGFRVVLYK